MTDLNYINAIAIKYNIKKVWESLDPRFKYEYIHPINKNIVKFGNPYVADFMMFRRNPTLQENWYLEQYYTRNAEGKIMISIPYTQQWSEAVFLM